MEEEEYKSTYNELASIRCIFEKARGHKQLIEAPFKQPSGKM